MSRGNASARTLEKVGRPRQYDLQPLDGFASEAVAWFAACLDELRERVEDQIDDLTADDLGKVPSGANFSIGALVKHLLWAELGWIKRITGREVPADLLDIVEESGQAVRGGRRAAVSLAPEALIYLCRRIRDEVTVPALRMLGDVDVVTGPSSQPVTPRGVLMHLTWHWTYHSGQIGLLRELLGYGYTWTLGPLTSRSTDDE